MPEPVPPPDVDRRVAAVLSGWRKTVRLFVRRLVWLRIDKAQIRERVYALVENESDPEDNSEIRELLRTTALRSLEETLAERTWGTAQECN
jgi:hypothetical protein